MVQLLVTNFRDGRGKIEIIQENGQTKICPQSIDFPLEVEDPAGAVMYDGTVVICGGWDGFFRSECYKLRNGVWQQRNQGLTTARYGHAASITASNTIWMTGGYNSGSLSSTEVIHPDGSVTPGPDLPEARGYHCQVSYQNTTLIIGKCYFCK